MPPPRNNLSPLHLAVQAMFTKQASSNPDPEVIGEEQAILVSRVHEYSTLQESKLSVQQNNRGAAKPRFIVISFVTRRADHANQFYIRKGRVNTNGTAQVGRTWDMISFSKAEPYDLNLPLLIVSFQKPYFWVFDSTEDRRNFENVVADVYRRAVTISRAEQQQNQLLEQQAQQQKLQQQQIQQQHLQNQQQLLEDRTKKSQQELVNQERIQQERIQQERIQQERIQQERIQQQVLYEEKLKQEKAKQEEQRLHQERLQNDRAQKERSQNEKIRQEQQHQIGRPEQERGPQEYHQQGRAQMDKPGPAKTQTMYGEQDCTSRDQNIRLGIVEPMAVQQGAFSEQSKPAPISVSSTHTLPQIPVDIPDTPPVPDVSRKRTMVKSHNLNDGDDELNQASMDIISDVTAPTPPPHLSNQSSTSVNSKASSYHSHTSGHNSIPPLRPNIPTAQPKRSSSRSYRQPLHPDEVSLQASAQASPSLLTRAEDFANISTNNVEDNDEIGEDLSHKFPDPATKSLLEPSPSLERPSSGVRRQRDSIDPSLGDLEGTPGASLSPLRSPQRTMKQSPSMNAILNSPMGNLPETRTEISDLFSVIQETKFSGDNLLDLERDVKLKLDSLSEQTFSNVTRADKYMAAIDKLVQSAINECESVDSKLQGIALELFGKSDDGQIKDLVQGSGTNLSETRSRFGPGSLGKYGSDRNNDQVTTLKYRQLAADIEKLLDVSRLDDAFVKELSEFRFLPPNSAQSVNQVAFVERLLVDLSQALEMFNHRADSSRSNGLGDDSTTMQVFLEPKRTADDLAIRFGSQFQQFIDSQMKDLLDPEKAATMFSQPFLQGLESHLLDSFMPYASCMLFVKENVPNLHKNMMNIYERRVRTIYERGFTKLTRQWCLQLQKIVGERRELTFNPNKTASQSPSIGNNAPQNTSLSSQNTTDTHTTLDHTYTPLPPQKLRELQAHYVRFVDDFSRRIAGQQIFIENFFFVGSESNIKLAKYVSSTPAQKRTTRLQRLLESIGKLEFSSIDASKSTSWGIMNIMQNNIMPALSETVNRTVISATVDYSVSESSFLMMLLDLKAYEIRQTNQQYLAGMLDKSRKQLGELIEKFVGRRTRSILSSTFITKKRVGVHHRVVQFTKNVAVYEANMNDALKLRRGQYMGDESRRLFDQCYANVFRALAQGLQVDSRSNSSLGASTALGQSSGSTNNAMSTLAGTVGVGVGGNDEAKEKLNYHVVMVENLFQLIHDLRPLADGETSSPELQRIVGGATKYYKRELNAYISDVISRPMGKVMVFLNQHDNAPGKNTRPKDTVSALKRAVKGTDAKELRVGIENLRKRVEKHFQGADRAVLDTVWEEIKAEYLRIYARLTHIAQSVDAMNYIDFTRSDIMRSM